MTSKARVCRVCRCRPAAVPDRENPQMKPWAQVCGECHARRLRGDLIQILSRPVPVGPDPRAADLARARDEEGAGT